MRRGWYILVGVTAALIAVLIGFAAYMTITSSRANCAPGVIACTPPPASP